jgi:hypothetical protein
MPKILTATDLLTDLIKYQKAPPDMKQSIKHQLTNDWRGKQWLSEEMREWAKWAWQEAMK